MHSHAQLSLWELGLNAVLRANRACSIKLCVVPLTKSAGVPNEQALHSASPRNLEVLHFATSTPHKLHAGYTFSINLNSKP